MLSGQKGESLLPQASSKRLSSSSAEQNRLSPSKAALNEQISKSRQDSPKKKKKSSDTQFTTVLKIFNIIVGICVVAFGVMCYKFWGDQTNKQQFLGFILPGYIAFSGLIILLLECNISFIVRNMRFLYNFIGRGFFNIYVGIMPLSLIRNEDQDQTFQVIIYVMVSLMCFIGVLYIVSKIFCCAKEDLYKKKKKKKPESDSDSDSQSSD